MVPDLVIATCNRPGPLRRTLRYLAERTRHPYRLTLIDDGTRNRRGVRQALTGIESWNFVRRERSLGIPANLWALLPLTVSDPIVYSDDDVLCPAAEPDWLSRGLELMARYPRLGLLALNEVGAEADDRQHLLPEEDQVWSGLTLCNFVGGTFLFLRRAVLAGCPLEKLEGQSPIKYLCAQATGQRWAVGYISDLYAYHFGRYSHRLGREIGEYVVDEKCIDPLTLKPTRKE